MLGTERALAVGIAHILKAFPINGCLASDLADPA